MTNDRSVWNFLASCQCCPEPTFGGQQEILVVPERLQARIRWYDHVQLPSTTSTATRTTTSGSQQQQPLSPDKIRSIQVHFVSHHQRIELILHRLQYSLNRIYTTLQPHVVDADAINKIPEPLLQQVFGDCQLVTASWCAVGQLMRGVSRMDRMDYLAYVPRLAGVSGGNSPTMMPLTAKTGNLESLLACVSLDELAHNIRERTVAGRLAEAFIDCLDALSRCWLEHVVTATTTIGITQGTKGTPNTILVERVLRRLHSSQLLLALGSLRPPITGVGVEMHQLCDYQNYPLQDHYLDLFADPGPEFGTHNVGWLPKAYESSRADFYGQRRRQRTALWNQFYNETRPAYCRALLNLLGLKAPNDEGAVAFGLGSSVTDVLSRLITSLLVMAGTAAENNNLQVLLADDEFLTMQRAAAILGRAGASVKRVPVDELADLVESSGELYWSSLGDDDEKKDPERPALVSSSSSSSPIVRQVVMLSLVNSCTQQVVQQLDWVGSVRKDVLVILDITQAVANIPLERFRLNQLAAQPNVFIVGSLIKHARCGENLGFMTFAAATADPQQQHHLVSEPASGWAAYCSGLRHNETADFEDDSFQLYYDAGLEFDGGTPSGVEAMYVATKILESMPPVEAQHAYVQGLKNMFLEKARHLLSDWQLENVSESNTLALPVSSVLGELPYGMDYKTVQGRTYLRIGFGIHNLQYHITELVKFLEESGALK